VYKCSEAVFQADSKFSQIQQNRAKPEQNRSKKKAWICLDSLFGIEPFQRVAATPGAFFSFLPVSADKELASDVKDHGRLAALGVCGLGIGRGLVMREF
jgi:hypothetical protein